MIVTDITRQQAGEIADYLDHTFKFEKQLGMDPSALTPGHANGREGLRDLYHALRDAERRRYVSTEHADSVVRGGEVG